MAKEKINIITPQQLIKWHNEAFEEITGESYNSKDPNQFDKLSEDQKFVEKYVADKINEKVEQGEKEEDENERRQITRFKW